MDTSRDRAAGGEGGTSIRLRYSRQFQSGGHAHSIDAEATLPVGASQERREQVIRELESGVEQLARQIIQRASHTPGETRAQAPARPATANGSLVPTPGRNVEAPAQRQAIGPATSATREPLSESMPATPTRGHEGNTVTVRLPQFINAIKKRWDMSLKEAMDLLHVTTLEGANLREVYAQLQTIVEAKNAPPAAPQPPQPRITQASPVVEAPRQAGQNAPSSSPAHPPLKQTPAPATSQRSQGQAALKEPSKSPAAASEASSQPMPADEPRSEAEAGFDFAVAAKSALPIQLGVVRDVAPRTYKFEEEEDEDELDLPGDDDGAARLRAQFKLDELREVRGTNAASAERLVVLNNVADGQISEEQMERVIQAAWGTTAKKRLKAQQVEKLISWAKEDFFAEEVEAMLELLEEGEG